MNKLLNLLKEVKNVAFFAKEFDLLALLEAASVLLEKDWLRPESLYLTLK